MCVPCHFSKAVAYRCRLSPAYIATYYDLDPVEVEDNLNVLGRVYDDDGTFHEDRDKIRKFYEGLPMNALVIIDEAQNYFSSREFTERTEVSRQDM